MGKLTMFWTNSSQKLTSQMNENYCIMDLRAMKRESIYI